MHICVGLTKGNRGLLTLIAQIPDLTHCPCSNSNANHPCSIVDTEMVTTAPPEPPAAAEVVLPDVWQDLRQSVTTSTDENKQFWMAKARQGTPRPHVVLFLPRALSQ